MTETSQRRAPVRFWWVVAALLVIAVNVLLLGYQAGECVDYPPESGLESTCTSGPAIGIPGTWAVGAVSLLAVIYFIYRLVRPAR